MMSQHTMAMKTGKGSPDNSITTIIIVVTRAYVNLLNFNTQQRSS